MTGAGMMDCKKALTETDGDFEKAIEFIRKSGQAVANKRADRETTEGCVLAKTNDGKFGVILALCCETDFVAKNEGFKNFVKDVAMHIAAANPLYVTKEEVPMEEIEKEKEVLRAQALNEGKPEKIIDKMVEGRVSKYLKEICLLEQPFVKNPDLTIEDLVKEQIMTIGENVKIRRFARFQMGEGLEKKEENFAEEVAKQLNA